MDTQNKVTVKRIEQLGDTPYFQVSWGNPITFKVFSFMKDVGKDSMYDEERTKQRAMEFATTIEKGHTNTEEIIYQTPEN